MKLILPDERIFLHAKVEKINILSEKLRFDGSKQIIAECIIGDQHGCGILLARDRKLSSLNQTRITGCCQRRHRH